MKSIQVKDIKVVDFKPKIDDPVAAKLLSTKYYSSKMTFKLIGAHVCIANGLRRAILAEVPVKALNFELDDYETTDLYMLNDFIRDRVKQIPIDQKTPQNAVFSLDVKNDTDQVMYVKTGDLKIVSGPKNLPCNETFVITKLDPGKSVKIKNITIVTGYGYNYGGFTVAQNALCRALDQKPYNFYTNEGVSSLVSDPWQHEISFTTNGTIEPESVVTLACDELIKRFELIQSQLTNIYSSEEGIIHILTIGGENATTGHAIHKSISVLYPEIKACSFDYNPTSKVAKWSIKTDEKTGPPKKVFEAAISYCITAYKQIKAALT